MRNKPLESYQKGEPVEMLARCLNYHSPAYWTTGVVVRTWSDAVAVLPQGHNCPVTLLKPSLLRSTAQRELPGLVA